MPYGNAFVCIWNYGNACFVIQWDYLNMFGLTFPWRLY